MRSKTYGVSSMVETLEGRRMFSAGGAAEGAHVVPFIGPMEAHEYAAAQAQVKMPVASGTGTIEDVKVPTPRNLIFWAKPQSTSNLGGWLRSGSDD